MQNTVTPSPAPDAVLETEAQDLVWLGETADGTRDEELLLVLDQNSKPQLRRNLEPGDKMVVKVRTKSTQPERVKVLKVTCHVQDSDPIELSLADGFDAVFWTESAVEKFVYPYYHSQRLWDEEMEAVKRKFESDPEAVAIAHQYPSRSLLQYMRPADSLKVGQVVRAAGEKKALKLATVRQYLGRK